LFGSTGKGLADLGIHPGEAAAYGFLDFDPAEVCTWLALISARFLEHGPPERPPVPSIE
jgi:hypothetical protein